MPPYEQLVQVFELMLNKGFGSKQLMHSEPLKKGLFRGHGVFD